MVCIFLKYISQENLWKLMLNFSSSAFWPTFYHKGSPPYLQNENHSFSFLTTENIKHWLNCYNIYSLKRIKNGTRIKFLSWAKIKSQVNFRDFLWFRSMSYRWHLSEFSFHASVWYKSPCSSSWNSITTFHRLLSRD